MTRDFLRPGRINPFQYGQFIEYLCDLVPGMWAEKLYDGSFEGLSPYKFAYLKETDFREKPWYPSGATNRAMHDARPLDQDQRRGLPRRSPREARALHGAASRRTASPSNSGWPATFAAT